jgi:hypothetical protein
LLAVGDLNHDSHPDLVATSIAAVRMRLGDGLGGFGPELPPYPTSQSGEGSQLADVDGDGHIDIVVPVIFGWLDILFGDGAGGFTLAKLSSPYQSQSVVVGDVNGDGDRDLVIGTLRSELGTLHSNGGRSFGTAKRFPMDAGGGRIAIGDMNGDNHKDVVITTFSPQTSALLLGNGDGTLAPLSPPAAANDVALTDMDHDGYLDVGDSLQLRFRLAERRWHGPVAARDCRVMMESIATATWMEMGCKTSSLNGAADVISIYRNLGDGTARTFPGLKPRTPISTVSLRLGVHLMADSTSCNNASNVPLAFVSERTFRSPVGVESFGAIRNRRLDGDGILDIAAPFNPCR